MKAGGTTLIGTIALVPQIVDAVSIPVIASVGIMDAWGVTATLALGAGAVQMGSALLVCDESGATTAFMSLWVGQGAGMARRMPAAELIAAIRDHLAAV